MQADPNITKVYVQRDYSEGTAVQFQNKFPLELEGKITRPLFDQTIQMINKIFSEAEKTSAGSIMQEFCACLTGFIVYLCFDTHYERCMKKLAQYVHQQNETVYAPRGLLITSPMERGLRVIEISFIST